MRDWTESSGNSTLGGLVTLAMLFVVMHKTDEYLRETLDETVLVSDLSALLCDLVLDAGCVLLVRHVIEDGEWVLLTPGHLSRRRSPCK